MSIADLFVEAERQLTICNSCRYCEGYCAVFPALERRGVLDRTDLVQLANICHDCRACFQACMYTAPHEFDLNPPAVLAEVRLASYDDFVWPAGPRRWLRGWTGVAATALGSLAVVALVLVLAGHPDRLFTTPAGAFSPYDLLPYGPTLALVGLPSLFAVVAVLVSCVRFWRGCGGRPRDLAPRAVGRALWQAATMRYLRGGGDDCYYPDKAVPTPVRRRLHAAVMYGFALTVVSTTAAAVEQDLLGLDPPYPLVSVPVLSGTLGGVALTVGCVGLVVLKARASTEPGSPAMTVKDYGLLVALAFLAVSGLLTLAARSSLLFGLAYLVHLAAVVLAFVAVPYSKFLHVPFRLLALVKDNGETP